MSSWEFCILDHFELSKVLVTKKVLILAELKMKFVSDVQTEKNELRDEKQRLKTEKERLEQQLKSMNAQPSFMPPPQALPAAFAAQGQAHGNKLVPFISYPGVAMWQFLPPAARDTSQDHELRPPVA